MASSKIRDFTEKHRISEPLQIEVDYERRNLLKVTGRTFGIVYEGFKLQQLYLSLLREEERNIHHLHLVFTNQLFATFDHSNHRYHARVSVYGLPSLISTSGVVESPAKPMEYYLKKQLGVSLQQLQEEYKESFLNYDDHCITEVLKGYVVQALFYYLAGEPFCKDQNCRLFNAHTQSELLHAQLYAPYEFCPSHQSMLDRLNEV